MPPTAIITRALNFGTDPVDGSADVMIFDSVIREKHQFHIEITKNPVETGQSLADHAYVAQVPLELEIAVSDTPFLDSTGLPLHGQVWTSGASTRRSVVAWQAILDKAASFAVFDVQTCLKLYENMMFQDGSAEQKKDSAGILRATIQLIPVQFATTATVVYPPRGPKKTGRQAAHKTDAGKKEAGEPSDAQKKPVSIAAQIVGLGN
jgi:hypothetical protein